MPIKFMNDEETKWREEALKFLDQPRAEYEAYLKSKARTELMKLATNIKYPIYP